MSFPPPHIVEPSGRHTHTIILLHGRSSNGPEFAEELFESKSSEDKSLYTHFSGCRWVFPTSRDRWCSVFGEERTAWFDAYSLSSPNERQDLQRSGLRESASYILEIMRREIDILGGRSERVVLGGMSQGMATALWALLWSMGRTQATLGAFFGMCGWLPFSNKIQDLQGVPADPGTLPMLVIPRFVLEVLGSEELQAGMEENQTMLSTPVLLLHGTDDAWVDVELGREARRSLIKLGMHVDWKEYSGAENEGHWVKQPEGIDAIVRFLEATFQGQGGEKQGAPV